MNPSTESSAHSYLELEGIEQILKLTAHHQKYSVPLERVERVLPLMTLQALPGGPAYLVGLLNLNGVSLPVIDLCIRLGMNRVEKYSSETSVVLCRDGERLTGLIATTVDGIETVNIQQMQMQPDFQQADLPYLATINSQHGSSLLLDIPRIITVDLIHQDADQLNTISSSG